MLEKFQKTIHSSGILIRYLKTFIAFTGMNEWQKQQIKYQRN